jgi:tetratricopeptide (TPR) repeat protein
MEGRFVKGLTIKGILLCILTMAAGSCITRQSLRQSTVSSKSAYEPIGPTSISQYMRAVYKLSSEGYNKQTEQRTKLLSQFPELAELANRIEQNPGDADARSRLASAYIDNQLYWAAYELLTESQSVSPGDNEAYLNLARIWDVWSEYDLALNYAERAIDNGASSPRAYELMGRIQLHRKAPFEAIGWYERAAQLENDATVLANLGYAYILSSDWEKAKTTLEKASELDSTIPEPHNNLALVLTKLGDEKGALSQLLKTAKAPVAFNNMGALYLQEKKFDRAQMYFEEALRLDPQYEIAQRNLIAVQVLTPPSGIIHLPSFGVHTTNDGVSVNCPEPENTNPPTVKTDVSPSISVQGDLEGSTGIVETDVLPLEQLSAPQANVANPSDSAKLPTTSQPEPVEVIVQNAHRGAVEKEKEKDSDIPASIPPQTRAAKPQHRPTEKRESAVSESESAACMYSNPSGSDRKMSISSFNLDDPRLIMGGIVLLSVAGAAAMLTRKRPVIPNLTRDGMKETSTASQYRLKNAGMVPRAFPRAFTKSG